MSTPRMRRKTLYLIGAWVGAPLLALIVIFNPTPQPIALAIAVLALLAAIALSTAWFRSLDEVAQRAHYEAWFWGGNCGLFLLPLTVVVMALTGVDTDVISHTLAGWMGHDTTLGTAFTAGVFAVVLPMMAGYTIWWVWFWLRNR